MRWPRSSVVVAPRHRLTLAANAAKPEFGFGAPLQCRHLLSVRHTRWRSKPQTEVKIIMAYTYASKVDAVPLALEWSHSRQRRYDECHRAHYYVDVARDGWKHDAPEIARIARRLKSLTALPLVIGGALHDRASEIAGAVRANEPIPSLVHLRQRTSSALNNVWAASRDRRAQWLAQLTRVPMLIEWYYGRVPGTEKLAALREYVEHRQVTLRHLALWGELGCAEAPDIMRVDKWESYTLPDTVGTDHVKVWAAPDLVMRLDGDG